MSVSPPIPAQSAAPARIEAIDGLRGAFLVLMTITHAVVPGGSILKAFHPDTVAFIDSASGFVFLSGLMAGLVYSRVAVRHGMGVAARRMMVRAGQLYLYAVGLVLALAMVSVLAPGAARSWAEWAGPLTTPDLRAVIAAALLLQEASFADVLPMYAVFLVGGAFWLHLCLTGRTVAVLATSVLVWAVVQVGLTAPLTAALAQAMTRVRGDLNLPDAFNIAAWQILFVAGLALGAAWSQGRLKLDAIFRPQSTYLVWLSVGAAAAIAAATLGLRLNHLEPQAAGSLGWLIQEYTSKERLGLACLLNFAIYAYPAAWLLIAGRQTSDRVLRPVAGLFAALVNAPFLRLLGRHSLQVYAWQVVVIYGLKLVDDHIGASSPLLNAAMILGCIALLAVPAVARERLRSGRGARPETGPPTGLQALPLDNGMPQNRPSLG